MRGRVSTQSLSSEFACVRRANQKPNAGPFFLFPRLDACVSCRRHRWRRCEEEEEQEEKKRRSLFSSSRSSSSSLNAVLLVSGANPQQQVFWSQDAGGEGA